MGVCKLVRAGNGCAGTWQIANWRKLCHGGGVEARECGLCLCRKPARHFAHVTGHGGVDADNRNGSIREYECVGMSWRERPSAQQQ